MLGHEGSKQGATLLYTRALRAAACINPHPATQHPRTPPAERRRI